jgi:hypothetical protein
MNDKQMFILVFFPFILKIKRVLSSALLYNFSYSGRIWLLSNEFSLQASCCSYTPLSGTPLRPGKDRGRFPTMAFSVIVLSYFLELREGTLSFLLLSP